MKRTIKKVNRPLRKLILRNFQSPGDIVMLTAAVRDLHRCYPGRFVTDVRTPCPALWKNNPYLTPLKETGRGVEVIDCHYPLIHQSNQLPHHFLEGFIAFLNQKLRLRIQLTEFRGDIHLSEAERSWEKLAGELVGTDSTPSPSSRAKSGTRWNASLPGPFWLIVAGGKRDFTIKWWSQERYQAVVDYFAGKIQFVQVGERSHVHPPLRGVVDLRGKTDLRQLVRLMHHAQGVVCPVTLAMHLAAAVPLRPVQSLKSEVQSPKPKVQSLKSGVQGPKSAKASPTLDIGLETLDFHRPCVVIAGGREPAQWEAYPGHQFLHTVGALPCCATGGCWKSRTVPLDDGDAKNLPAGLCEVVLDGLPHCMDLITADDVVRAIELYFDGGTCEYSRQKLTDNLRAGARRGLSPPALQPPAPPPALDLAQRPPGRKASAAQQRRPTTGDGAMGGDALTRPAATLSTPKTLTPDPSRPTGEGNRSDGGWNPHPACGHPLPSDGRGSVAAGFRGGVRWRVLSGFGGVVEQHLGVSREPHSGVHLSSGHEPEAIDGAGPASGGNAVASDRGAGLSERGDVGGQAAGVRALPGPGALRVPGGCGRGAGIGDG